MLNFKDALLKANAKEAVSETSTSKKLDVQSQKSPKHLKSEKISKTEQITELVQAVEKISDQSLLEAAMDKMHTIDIDALKYSQEAEFIPKHKRQKRNKSLADDVDMTVSDKQLFFDAVSDVRRDNHDKKYE